MPGREEKFSVLKMDHNFSVYLNLGIHYEHNMLTASAKIITIHIVLRVLSAEFQTSRSETHHYRSRCNPSLLDLYLYNLPSSAKMCFSIKRIERIDDFK